jgi:hypothetical protein
MTRRDALLRLTVLFGGTDLLSSEALALLNEVGETILPTTEDSAGAKAANVAAFMQSIVRDFYDEREREVFIAGIAQLNDASRAQFAGRDFMALSNDQRHELLLAFERAKPPPEYYRMMKQLTVWGYFSSEIGAKQALNYLPVPGMYQGCITVEPGAKAWAN